MQLERGKSSTSLLGSFRSIIREEGCVPLTSPVASPNGSPFAFITVLGVSTAVGEGLLQQGTVFD